MDANANVVAKYTYNAWGKLLAVVDANGTVITSSSHIANINPLRYRGYYWDAETGFYYLQSRYYDPIIGRFINADTLLDSSLSSALNLFAYCFNCPVNTSDPKGTTPPWKRDYGNGVVAYADTGTGTPQKKTVSGSSSITPKVEKPSSTKTNTGNYSGTVQQYTDSGTGTPGKKQQVENNNNTSSVAAVGYSITYGLCIDGNFGASYVWDDLGNKGIAITLGIGGGLASSPSQSVSVLTASNSSSIYDLQGWGVSTGSTVAIVSVEAALGKDSYGVFVGGWPGLGIEFHANMSYTWIIPIGDVK